MLNLSPGFRGRPRPGLVHAPPDRGKAASRSKTGTWQVYAQAA